MLYRLSRFLCLASRHPFTFRCDTDLANLYEMKMRGSELCVSRLMVNRCRLLQIFSDTNRRLNPDCREWIARYFHSQLRDVCHGHRAL